MVHKITKGTYFDTPLNGKSFFYTTHFLRYSKFFAWREFFLIDSWYQNKYDIRFKFLRQTVYLSREHFHLTNFSRLSVSSSGNLFQLIDFLTEAVRGCLTFGNFFATPCHQIKAACSTRKNFTDKLFYYFNY